MSKSPVNARDLADRLTAWARGSQSARPNARVATIVCEDARAVTWLADPRTGLVAEDSVVLVRQGRRSGDLPDGPGQWVPVSGSLVEPGDEMEVDREFWVQTTDYLSLRYLGVVGPTVVRVQTVEDAEAFLIDVHDAARTGVFPETLVHGAVELGDRCALTSSGCTSFGISDRLHIDTEGLVRCSPHGCVLGGVGDTAERLAEAATAAAHAGDACLCEAVVDRLREGRAIGRYLRALDAVRVMTMSTNSPWRVCGLGFSLLGDVEEPGPRDTDLLVLASLRDHVLYDGGSRRGFRVDRAVGEVLEALLTSADDGEASRRLQARGEHADARTAINAVRAAFAAKGVQVPAAMAEAASR